MSAENALKERLSRIAQNDYHVSDETEVWPLAVQMAHSLGSIDPDLRELIDNTLDRWTESYFASFELPPTYQEWLRKRTNIKHFMRSLYFRSLYQGVVESFEPALGQTLKEISNREIPSTYF